MGKADIPFTRNGHVSNPSNMFSSSKTVGKNLGRRLGHAKAENRRDLRKSVAWQGAEWHFKVIYWSFRVKKKGLFYGIFCY
jgi:hypothetical protein